MLRYRRDCEGKAGTGGEERWICRGYGVGEAEKGREEGRMDYV